ncbi:hypothetical protein QBC35DRAFT_478287 [Podospora australis]|uniref:Clr5 domain-containing protein n=1 Tax=Podospora australis TaxID=1536484 RepID=A0AAN7AEU5_9PEZI|nr:hypothetical protein QBC35DRAFT_478287 [Podospora australis]
MEINPEPGAEKQLSAVRLQYTHARVRHCSPAVGPRLRTGPGDHQLLIGKNNHETTAMNEAARRQSIGWVGGDEWDIHKGTISDLYQTQNLPLKDVMKVMEDRHGFRATIKSWGLDKNFKECEVVELFRLRRERERAGKTYSKYMLRGREVDWDRVQNYVRRKGLNISQLLAANATAPLARDVTCTTPPPSSGSFREGDTGEGQHGDGHYHRHEDHNPAGSSPSCSSPSPSPPSISPLHGSAFALPPARNQYTQSQPQKQQQLTPISPVTVDGLLNKAPAPKITTTTTTTSAYHHAPPRRPPPPLLPKPSPHRRASYPLPPPRTTGPLHRENNQNQYHLHHQQPLPPTYFPFQPTSAILPDSIVGVSQDQKDTAHQLESFQLFLTRLYKNTMFQDGDKAWGTTEYWLRNTRSLEWFMGIRYKLALHRDEIFMSDPAPSSGSSSSRLKQFQTLNRAFAVLQPLSKGAIPSRMCKMMAEIQKKCGRPAHPETTASPSSTSPGGGADKALVCSDEMAAMMMDIDEEEDSQEHDGLDNGNHGGGGARTKRGWYVDANVGYQETAMRFLIEILERMYRDLMDGCKSGLSMETALLLEEDRAGFPVLRNNNNWQPRPSLSLSRMSISSVSSSHHGQNSLLTPLSAGPADGSPSPVEMLETAIWLLSLEEDVKAEAQLRALIETAERQQQGGKTAGAAGMPPPSPNRSSGFGGIPVEHVSGGGPMTQSKVFARCAHYHLSRIYRRQGHRAEASEHLRLSVEGSLLFDEFTEWKEVEFLFA